MACLCFTLYAIVGRGFAYLGFAPLYIGELLLFCGLVAGFRTRSLITLAFHPLGLCALCFLFWQAACSFPYYRTYGIDTLRDSVTWGYSLFAWVTAGLALRLPGFFPEIITRFKKFGALFLFLGPVSALLSEVVAGGLPRWPGTDVTIPSLKCGDLCVHLAGIVCFLLVGFARNKKWWILPALCGLVIGSSINRGGGIAFVAAITVILVLYPKPQRLFVIASGILVVFLFLTNVDFRIKVARSDREISSEQLMQNISSVGGTKQDSADLQATKRWRMEWWRRIFEYTVHGPYFWTGKGYGVNLTISDGIESPGVVGGGLRSPHNSHLTFLARSGVPGFFLWLLLQGSWCGTILAAHFRARSLKLAGWAAFFAWVLAYWVAFLLNASFDVSLEGPTIAVPFWSIWGLGWGASLVFQRQLQRESRPASFPADQLNTHFEKNYAGLLVS